MLFYLFNRIENRILLIQHEVRQVTSLIHGHKLEEILITELAILERFYLAEITHPNPSQAIVFKVH